MSMDIIVNFPFYTYPNIAISQYCDFAIYRENVQKLYDYIKSYDPKPNTFFHLIIGSAMEEHICRFKSTNYIEPYDYQWRQLFPFWLDRIIKNTNTIVEIIIVSPDEQFCNNDYQLEFIKHTNDSYEWYINDNVIRSKKFKNIVITIFGTFFPHICDRNRDFINFYKKQNKDFLNDVISNIRQTNDDIHFINNFYYGLTKLFDKIIDMNGFISCCSYAVFNSTLYSHINKYTMFKELLNIIKKYPNKKIMCTEWIYRVNFYCVVDMCSTDEKYYSYVEPSEKFLDGLIPIINICVNNTNSIIFIEAKKYLDYINIIS